MTFQVDLIQKIMTQYDQILLMYHEDINLLFIGLNLNEIIKDNILMNIYIYRFIKKTI